MEDPLWMFEEQRATHHEIVFPMQMDPHDLARAVDALAERSIVPLGFTLELERDGARAHLWAADPEAAIEALEAEGFTPCTIAAGSEEAREPTVQRERDPLERQP